LVEVSQPTRQATVADASEVARLLHDFNTEFASPSPGVAVLAERAEELLARGAITVVLVDEPPVGLAMVRFRPSIWTGALDAYVEELYVAPDRRGRGLGRSLLDRTIEIARQAGAVRLELVAEETDTAARGLYESSGMVCREGGRQGPLMLYYEREI
jgi:ribosomal protein S18 acetylase RimI-like enzyme